MTDAIRDIFNRIPALRELHGGARLDAEEVLQNALDDAVQDYLADCAEVELTGGAP